MITLENTEENFPYICPLCGELLKLKRNKNDRNLLDKTCPKCKLKISIFLEDWEEL